MNTTQIMQLALHMAGMKKVPADSGIHVEGNGISRILFGLDVGTSELLLARQLGCDAVVAHHPLGSAIVTFPQVLQRHMDFLAEQEVPTAVAEAAVSQLRDRIEVRSHPANYDQVVSSARRLKLPLLNIHLPLDELGRRHLLKVIEGAKAGTVGELVAALSAIPEFRRAKTKIEVRLGSASNQVGKVTLVFGAGTNGGYPVAKAFFDHGVETVIYLHIDYEDLKRLREEETSRNLMILGHVAGDSIGINAFIRELREQGLEVEAVGIIEG